ncbi:MAG: hypothetical protein AAFP26_05940 [Planctomycetota bacterium]
MTPKQRMLIEATTKRDEAEALLRTLLDAKATSERNLRDIGRDDMVKRVTGRSSLDRAVASAQRLLESFNRVLGDLRRELDEEDLKLLASLDAEPARA